MGRVEQVGEKEADKLEKARDHGVPDETKERSNRHAVNVNFVGTAHAGRENRRFPIWGSSVGRGLFVGLLKRQSNFKTPLRNSEHDNIPEATPPSPARPSLA